MKYPCLSVLPWCQDEAEGEDPAEDEDAADPKGGNECDNEDSLEELPSSINRRVNRWRGPITRKASQTSVYLQEWDIPYEQLQLEELIGKVSSNASVW